MAKRIDPEEIETNTVLKHVPFGAKDVLEIGRGDGRLTFKCARTARRVTGIDPDTASIEKAKNNIPKDLISKLEFHVGKGEALTFPNGSFDIVFFTWSLCCADIPVMGRTLEEAWRVLKPDGILINLQPSLQQPFNMGAITYLIMKKFGTSVDDERYRQSRFALKYSSLIQERFNLIVEEDFTDITYYDTIEDALDDVTRDAKEKYSRLDEETKHQIYERLHSRLTEKGVSLSENAVLSVFRKVS